MAGFDDSGVELPDFVAALFGISRKVVSDLHWAIPAVLLAAFLQFQKQTVTVVMSRRLLAYSSSRPNGRIFVKFDIEGFIKICGENSSLFTIGEKYRAIYTNT